MVQKQIWHDRKRYNRNIQEKIQHFIQEHESPPMRQGSCGTPRSRVSLDNISPWPPWCAVLTVAEIVALGSTFNSFENLLKKCNNTITTFPKWQISYMHIYSKQHAYFLETHCCPVPGPLRYKKLLSNSTGHTHTLINQ